MLKVMDLDEQKQAIRKEVSKRIAGLTEEAKVCASNKIRDLIVLLKEFIRAKVIMVYLAKKDEVDTTPIIEEARKLGKKVVVPVVDGSDILPCELTEELAYGPFSVLQPVERKKVATQELDLVIVPGRAFDLSGRRLGRGRGFYDRFLLSLPETVPVIGICYSCQVFDSIPSGSYDRKVHRVVSA